MIKITKPVEVLKSWGKELIIDNNEEYCGKILFFRKDSAFSTHFHLLKKESWLVLTGSFILKHYDLGKALPIETQLNVGDVLIVERGEPHKLIALEDSQIVEVSTTHFDSDSYRIEK